MQLMTKVRLKQEESTIPMQQMSKSPAQTALCEHPPSLAGTRPRRLVDLGLGKIDRRTVPVGSEYQVVTLPKFGSACKKQLRCDDEPMLTLELTSEAAEATARKLTAAAFEEQSARPPMRFEDVDSDDDIVRPWIAAGNRIGSARSSFDAAPKQSLLALGRARFGTLACERAPRGEKPSKPAKVARTDDAGAPEASRKSLARARRPGASPPPESAHEEQTSKEQLKVLEAFIIECGGDSAMLSGWQARTETRKAGTSAGSTDTYFFSRDGKRFRSRFEAARHLGLQVPYRAPKTARKAAASKGTHEASHKASPLEEKPVPFAMSLSKEVAAPAQRSSSSSHRPTSEHAQKRKKKGDRR